MVFFFSTLFFVFISIGTVNLNSLLSYKASPDVMLLAIFYYFCFETNIMGVGGEKSRLN